jgi:hypothetical protein
MLIVGLINYILFQPGILLFQLFSVQRSQPLSPPFISGYFSDIVWCVAICLTVVVLEELKKLNQVSKISLLSLPFMTESAQRLRIINGTFDWYDIMSYALVILIFSLIFPPLNFIKMGKRKPRTWSFAIFIVFFAMAIASTAPKHYQAPKPQPCTTHKPLTYSPILVKMSISGSYTMKDLSGAQRYGYQVLMDELNSLSYGKYKLADGVTPNLDLSITINTDSYQHYGAVLYGSVYDGSFNYDWSTNYVTAEKLFSDMAAQINIFISNGWCKNCPSPCQP